MGDISAKRDGDGILRRARAFDDYYIWHDLIIGAARMVDLDLRQAKVEDGRILFQTSDKETRMILLDKDGRFDQAALYKLLTSRNPSAAARPAKPFTAVRVWNLGIVMAAKELGLDLEHPRIEPGRIVLQGPRNLQRVIPSTRKTAFISIGILPLTIRG